MAYGFRLMRASTLPSRISRRLRLQVRVDGFAMTCGYSMALGERTFFRFILETIL